MKTNRIIHFSAAVFGFAACATAGCAKNERAAAAASPSGQEVATSKATVYPPAPATNVPVATTASPDNVPAQWSDIKDDTYDTRAHFFPGLARLEARVDEQIRELNAKRAAMKSNANINDWDFAMKEMVAARSYLKSMGVELSKATPELWDQEKEKVGLAWVRTQAAYEKVKATDAS